MHFDWRALPAERIAALPMPVTVVLGELDPLVIVAERATLAARLAPKRAVTVARAGHIITDEIPGVVADELLALVRPLVAERE